MSGHVLTGEGSESTPPRRQRLQTMTFHRPRCLSCKSVHLEKYRSMAHQDDGRALAWMRCKECGQRFRLRMM
jgi:transcription elongation factor Elf1